MDWIHLVCDSWEACRLLEEDSSPAVELFPQVPIKEKTILHSLLTNFIGVYVTLFYKLINVRLLKINQQNDCEFVRWWHWLWWHNVHICKTCVQMAPCRLSYGAARGRLLLARGRLHVECRWKDGFACASGCGRSNDGLRTLTARRLYPTRLETRTKASNMCASLRAIETRWA